MGFRLPKPDLYFSKFTNTQLIQRAQQVHDALTADTTDFPTPPVSMAIFLTSISDLKTAQAAAVKGSKVQTTAAKDARKFVIGYMRTLGLYVQTVASGTVPSSNPNTVDTIKSMVLKSGFTLSADPGPAANKTAGVPIPQVKKAISREAGKLYILVRQQQKRKRIVIDTSIGRKMWSVRIRTSAVGSTPAGEWVTYNLTTSNMNIEGLTSGVQYDYQVAAVGGHNTKLNMQNPLNYTKIQSAWIK